jgi:histidine ammonia-lyase
VNQLVVGRQPLTIADVVAVAHGRPHVELDTDARVAMTRSRDVVEDLLAAGASVYGLTTGVGAQKRVAVADEAQQGFNRLMIGAHAVRHGDHAPKAFVRAMLVVRAAGLAQGIAGVRPEVVDAILCALNADAIPQVHMIGSIGQSDLAPLAEVAAALIGEGPDAELVRQAGCPTLRLEAREALALINANAFSVGIAALGLDRAERALDALELAAALTYEGLLANVDAIEPAVAQVRPHAEVASTIDRLRRLLEGGALLRRTQPPRSLQDPLCVRVVPQTHAAARHAVAEGIAAVETELRSAGDSPIVLSGERRAFSAGNFDITPVAVALDGARLGLAQAVTIAGERVQRLLAPAFSGLPSGLRATDDLPEDGLAVLGHGAAALAAEARLLAAPVTLEQPTSMLIEGIEDRITMAPVGARRLFEMAGHAIRLACVELVCAAQAIDIRNRANDLGIGTAAAYRAVRASIPFTGPGEAPEQNLDALEAWVAAPQRSNMGR